MLRVYERVGIWGPELEDAKRVLNSAGYMVRIIQEPATLWVKMIQVRKLRGLDRTDWPLDRGYVDLALMVTSILGIPHESP